MPERILNDPKLATICVIEEQTSRIERWRPIKDYQMHKIFLAIALLFLGGCNAAYIEAVNRQLADGYRWVKIPCRPASPDVPAITIDTADGQKLVCNVLRK